MPVRTLEDIPTEADADELIGDFERDGCTAVKSEQRDGKWKVVADCPDTAPISQ